MLSIGVLNSMICNVCQKKMKQTVHLTQMLEGEIKKMDMCESCAQQQGVDEPGMPLVDLLAGSGTIQLREATPKANLPSRFCPARCVDTAWLISRKPVAWAAHIVITSFEDQMDPMLRSIRTRASSILEKRQRTASDDRALRDQLAKLEKDLHQAVEEERYEACRCAFETPSSSSQPALNYPMNSSVRPPNLHQFLTPIQDICRRPGPFDRIVLTSRVRLARKSARTRLFLGELSKQQREDHLQAIQPVVEAPLPMKKGLCQRPGFIGRPGPPTAGRTPPHQSRTGQEKAGCCICPEQGR